MNRTTGWEGLSHSWAASVIWSADCLVAVAYVGSNPVVEVKPRVRQKKGFVCVFTKTFGFRPLYPCSVVRCERNCAQLKRPRE
jgi:hypothetical protein